MLDLIKFFTIIGTFVPVFGVFDFFLESKHRNKISEYIFGFHNIKFPEFESLVIQSLLKPFFKENKLKPLRVLLVYSMLGGIFLCSMWIYSSFENNGLYSVLGGIIIGLLCPLIAWPFDLWSLGVTQRIFLRTERRFPFSIFWIFVDIFLSLIPMLIMGRLIVRVIGNEFETPAVLIALFFSISATTSILVSILQAFTLLIGSVVRFLTYLTKLNQWVASVSKVHDYPFTFIGAIAGLLAASYVTFI